MNTLLLTHPAADAHVTPPGHPERVARLPAVLGALEDLGLVAREAPSASDEALLRCHPQRYLDRLVAATPRSGWAMLDADTHLAPGSVTAARHAVGGAVAAVDAVLDGKAGAAFVAMRPPGHHAEAETPMGFCLFGTVAIAARHALDARGVERVAVLDFDVHHGNGTQALLWDEPRALFCSSHQMPLWPGSGAATERGAHDNVVNAPLRPGSGGAEARAAWDRMLDRVRAFRPALVLVSAGFDAHRDDPLAGLNWTEDDFSAITDAICAVSAGCGAPVVSCLEGGYDLDALGRSARAHVQSLTRLRDE